MTDRDNPPRISVVIPHYNDPEALRHCLTALRSQQGTNDDIELIVVDNGSETLPRGICAEFPGVQLLSEPEPGPGPARSCGAGRARGEIVAFIDADCRAAPGWSAAIAAAFDDPSTQIAGGDVRIAPQQDSQMSATEAYESVFGYRMHLYIERDGYAATCNMAVRRDIFASVGPFAGIGTAEDMDWGRRATALGYHHTYVPEMRVYTPARRDFGELTRKWDRHIAHFYAENQTRPAAQARWLARTALVAASPAAELITVARSDRVSGLSNRAKALAVVTRLRLWRAGQMLRLAFGADPDQLAAGWRKS